MCDNLVWWCNSICWWLTQHFSWFTAQQESQFLFRLLKWTNIEGIEMDQIPKQLIHVNYTSISITSIVWPFPVLRFFWLQASVQQPTWRSSLSSLMRLLTAIPWAPDACSRAWLTYKDLDLHPIDGGWQWSISKNWGAYRQRKWERTAQVVDQSKLGFNQSKWELEQLKLA